MCFYPKALYLAYSCSVGLHFIGIPYNTKLRHFCQLVAENRTLFGMPNQEAPKHGILSVWHSFCNKFPSGSPQMRKKILIVEDIPGLIHILLLEVQRLAGCWKTPRLPFDELRANGAGVENIRDFPFMLSLSKH